MIRHDNQPKTAKESNQSKVVTMLRANYVLCPKLHFFPLPSPYCTQDLEIMGRFRSIIETIRRSSRVANCRCTELHCVNQERGRNSKQRYSPLRQPWMIVSND